jgi:hypothetical protein
MFGRHQNSARIQSDFYRDQFRRMIRWLIFMLAIMFILLLAIIYTLITQPTNRYYANTLEGQILSMPTPATLSSG